MSGGSISRMQIQHFITLNIFECNNMLLRYGFLFYHFFLVCWRHHWINKTAQTSWCLCFVVDVGVDILLSVFWCWHFGVDVLLLASWCCHLCVDILVLNSWCWYFGILVWHWFPWWFIRFWWEGCLKTHAVLWRSFFPRSDLSH